MVAEQRKYTRFSVPDNAYAALGPTFTMVGKIKDISMAGLALEYLTDEVSGLENSNVDIFLRGEEFHMSKIPCKLIYDIPLDSTGKNQIFPDGLMRKRCGVQFEKLSKIRRMQLEQFIATHTTAQIK
jgi:hypothetical protein